jgi:hypothetical protein
VRVEAFDLGGGTGLDRRGEDRAGVGDQHVDPPGLRDRGVDTRLVADVEPEPPVDGQVGEIAGIARGGDDAVAPGGEFCGDGAPDAPGGAGDENRGHRRNLAHRQFGERTGVERCQEGAVFPMPSR